MTGHAAIKIKSGPTAFLLSKCIIISLTSGTVIPISDIKL